MKTYLFEARQDPGGMTNWGKFMVAVPDSEWEWRSLVDRHGTASLLSRIGWTARHWLIMDLQTGEGAFFRPGGLAAADLDKHQIWVCPLFEPWLAWLYEQLKTKTLEEVPQVADLPDAPFSFTGYRRRGPVIEHLRAEFFRGFRTRTEAEMMTVSAYIDSVLGEGTAASWAFAYGMRAGRTSEEAENAEEDPARG